MRGTAVETVREDAFYDWPPEPACLGCGYYRPLYERGTGRGLQGLTCHYLLDTGRSRGCPFGPGCIHR